MSLLWCLGCEQDAVSVERRAGLWLFGEDYLRELVKLVATQSE